MRRVKRKEFKYASAADSSEPGYLRRKFDRIRAEQARQAAERAKKEKADKEKQEAGE